MKLLNLGVGLRNCIPFIKSKQQVYHNTCLILFHKRIIYIVLVQQRMLQHFIAEIMLSSALSFPYTMLKWNKLDRNIQQPKTMLSYRNSLLKIDRPIPKPIYNIHNPTGLKLLTLRLGMSHLNQDKFYHNFRGCVDTLCPCGLEIESSYHFFLLCHYFTDI